MYVYEIEIRYTIVYIRTSSECLCLCIYRPKRYYACMYVCCEHVCNVFTELIVTTRNYVIRKFYDKRCMFSVVNVTVKIAIMTIRMVSTR